MAGWVVIGIVVWLLAFFLFETVQSLTLVVFLFGGAFYSAYTINWHEALTPMAVLKLLVIVFCSSNVLSLLRHWWRVRHGLEQWPNPQGRYYDRWLFSKETNYDYYEWLAREKNWAEPWKTWAEMDNPFLRRNKEER